MDSSDGLKTVLSDTEQASIAKTEAFSLDIDDDKAIHYSVKEIESVEFSNIQYEEDTLYFKSLTIDEE